MFAKTMFTNWRRFLLVSINAFVEVAASITNISHRLHWNLLTKHCWLKIAGLTSRTLSANGLDNYITNLDHYFFWNSVESKRYLGFLKNALRSRHTGALSEFKTMLTIIQQCSILLYHIFRFWKMFSMRFILKIFKHLNDFL